MTSSKQKDFIIAPYDQTLDVAEGTPRSGKTTACIVRFAKFLFRSNDTNFLVVASSQQQAFRLVMDGDGNGLLHLLPKAKIAHDDHGDHLLVKLPNGLKRIYYKGGAKADSEKSIRGMSLGGVYFCEIDILNLDMIQECFRRTYAADIRWHLADLNPPAPNHPVISQVFDVQKTRWTHWTIDDNPIMTDERKAELYETLSKNEYLFRRDWLGERVTPQGVIYSMFDLEKMGLYKIPEKWIPIEFFFSADGGLTDATAVGYYGVYRTEDKYVLVRLASWFYDGANKAMSVQCREIAYDFVPWCRKRYNRETAFYVDPACKAMRKELELFGIVTEGADNNGKDVRGNRKGIEVGIELLQSSMTEGRFFLLDNPEWSHELFMREIGMYCVDSNGHPLDAYNHDMDETRYAHNHFAKTYVY